MTLKHNPTFGRRNTNKSHIRDLQKGRTGTYIAVNWYELVKTVDSNTVISVKVTNDVSSGKKLFLKNKDAFYVTM